MPQEGKSDRRVTCTRFWGGRQHCMADEFQCLTGSYFLATYVAGTLFDREAQKFKHGKCKGPACFRRAFLIIAGFSAVAFIMSIVLHRRTKPLYKRVVEDTIAERKRRGREVRSGSLEEGLNSNFTACLRNFLSDLPLTRATAYYPIKADSESSD